MGTVAEDDTASPPTASPGPPRDPRDPNPPPTGIPVTVPTTQLVDWFNRHNWSGTVLRTQKEKIVGGREETR